MTRWHVGAMNDALYIIDGHPGMGNDLPPDRPGGQNAIAGPFPASEATALDELVEAHNREVASGPRWRACGACHPTSVKRTRAIVQRANP